MLIQLCQTVQQMSSWTIQISLLTDLFPRCHLSDPSMTEDTHAQISYIITISPGLSWCFSWVSNVCWQPDCSENIKHTSVNFFISFSLLSVSFDFFFFHIPSSLHLWFLYLLHLFSSTSFPCAKDKSYFSLLPKFLTFPVILITPKCWMNEKPVTTKCQIQLEIQICPLASPHLTGSQMAEEIMNFDEITCHWKAFINLSSLILKIWENR